MRLFESIADRRIREGRAAGAFDNLPGAGKPIPDLGQERPAGWWATRVVKTERDKLRHEELQVELRAAMAHVWRLPTAESVIERVQELNVRIDSHNAETSFLAIDRLGEERIVDRWRTVQRNIGA